MLEALWNKDGSFSHFLEQEADLQGRDEVRRQNLFQSFNIGR
jgi:hypothetical protein